MKADNEISLDGEILAEETTTPFRVTVLQGSVRCSRIAIISDRLVTDPYLCHRHSNIHGTAIWVAVVMTEDPICELTMRAVYCLRMSIRFEKIWVQQCKATKGIKRRFGVKSALDYLIREKLLNFAHAAEEHPEFARELPRFLAEVWRIFNQYEIAGYVAGLKPKQRKILRSLLYLRCATSSPATARVGSGDGLTALGQEYAQ